MRLLQTFACFVGFDKIIIIILTLIIFKCCGPLAQLWDHIFPHIFNLQDQLS